MRVGTFTAGAVRRVGVLAGLVAGVARIGVAQQPPVGAACEAAPSAPAAGLSPARAVALAGVYDLEVVADLGPRAGARTRGLLSLTATADADSAEPLAGWADVEGAVGLLTRADVASTFDTARGRLTLRLDRMHGFDGPRNELAVTRAAAGGFAGRWRTLTGPVASEVAAAYFCATRWRRR
jgi:hypothetical protein